MSGRHFALVSGWCPRCAGVRFRCRVDIAPREAYMDGEIVSVEVARASCPVCGEWVTSHDLDDFNDRQWRRARARFLDEREHGSPTRVRVIRSAWGPGWDDES